MSVEIVRNYKNLATEIGGLIDVAGYSSDNVAQKIRLSMASFAAKKMRNNLSVDEVEKIVRLLDEEKVESYLMVKIMDACKDERTVSLAEFKMQMGWK